MSIISANVNTVKINKFFGPRMNNNGWKYNNRPNKKLVGKITKLYCKVTRKGKICNKQPLITFAIVVVVESKGTPINWVAFGAHIMK